jgi:hypothetical protein
VGPAALFSICREEVTEPKLFVEVSGDIREEVDVAGPSSYPIHSGRKMIGLIGSFILGGEN